MGARPLVGRTFTAAEDQPGSDQVVVLSHRLWVRRFGGTPMLGRTLRHERARLSGHRRHAARLRPHHADSEQLWVPIAFTPEQKALHDEHYLDVYGRLKPGACRVTGAAAARRAWRRGSATTSRKIAASCTTTLAAFQDQFVGDYRSRLSRCSRP